MNKIKLTCEELIKRKDALIEGKKTPKTKDLYIESLDAVITIKQPDRDTVSDTQAIDNGGLSDRYLVYECCLTPNLKDSQLQSAYGCAEPDEIVDKIFELGELGKIAAQCTELAGAGNKVEEIKN